jgi:hypothetical protein
VRKPSPMTVALILLTLALNLIVLATRTSVTAHAQGTITLANLQGSYVGKSIGFTSVCTNLGGCSAGPVPLLSQFNFGAIFPTTVDGAGNFCAIATASNAPVGGSPSLANISQRTVSGSITSFNAAIEQGNVTYQIYNGGPCNGSVFNSAGATLTATGTGTVAVSSSGQEIDGVVTSYVDVAGQVGSVVNTVTYRKQ